ncbi:MAG: molecular chaperone DnaK [Akkermansiaceae bacterium]
MRGADSLVLAEAPEPVCRGSDIIVGEDVGSILVAISTQTFSTEALRFDYMATVCMLVIQRGTPLPVTRSEAFSTPLDNQERVEVTVLQGESTEPAENLKIGIFEVDGLD